MRIFDNRNRSKDIRDASEVERQKLVRVIEACLLLTHCRDNYRVVNTPLLIRESTTNPAPVRRELRLQLVLHNFRIEVLVGQIRAVSRGETVECKAMVVKRFNTDMLDRVDNLINILISGENFRVAGEARRPNHVPGRPNHVPEILWARIPSQVAAKWGEFSPELQDHLIQCVEADLPSLFSRISETAVGATFLSPIGLTPPALPVRLPWPSGIAHASYPRADANCVYDITEVLRFEGRHPMDCLPFRLNEIIPAPDALTALEERARRALPEGDADGSNAASPGDGGTVPARPR